MDYEGTLRRTNLNLRADYPELNTTIYKIKEDEFIVFCENCDASFSEIKENFERNIRPISAPVKLTTVKPNEFIEVVAPIDDKDIARNF